MNILADGNLLRDGPGNGALLVLAHGAGAPMDSSFMQAIAGLLAARGVHVVRFEFAYMAARRAGGGRKPPSRMPQLLQEYRSVLGGVANASRVFIGGKSMGGRVASLLAADGAQNCNVSGLVCLGYPFHPPGKPDKLRTAHLPDLACPALIVQGERDPFGTREEVSAYALPASIAFHWCPAGNHDLAPPKRSQFTAQANLVSAADAIAAFMKLHGG